MLPYRTRWALFGREEEGRRRTLAIAGGLFLGVFGGGLVSGGTLVTAELTSWLPLYVLGTFLLFVIAAGNAFNNDGLLLSWLIVFAPTLGMVLAMGANGTAIAILPARTAALAVLLAAFPTVTIGTLGYLFGSELSGLLLSKPRMNTSDAVNALLLGRDRFYSRIGIAAGLLVFLGLYWGIALGLLPDPGWLSTAGVGLVAATLVAIATVAALINDGLVVCWVLVAAPTLASVLAADPAGWLIPSTTSTVVAASFGIAVAGSAAGLLGTAGFAFGAGIRRIARDTRESIESSPD